MKRSSRNLFVAISLIVFSGAGWLGYSALQGGAGLVEQAEAAYYYTCPMHPSVVQDHPGDCPICGMSLVRKEREVSGATGMSEQEPTAHQHEGEAELQTETGETVYTCPMHPSVVQDHPGDCPICGMSLVPRREVSGEITEEEAGRLLDVTISPRQRVLANVATSMVVKQSLIKEIATVGRFDVDEQRLARVAAWVGGRVEILHVNFTGAEIRQGQPLLEMYSPALIQTMEEYLTTLDQPQSGGSGSGILAETRGRLREGARERLLLLGITEDQIEELERTRSGPRTTTILAPATGTVLRKMVQEGQYVQQGQTLFDIADLTTMWMYAEVYEYELPFLELGQEVQITTESHPGRTFVGYVRFIDPFVNSKTRSVAIRVHFSNRDGSLRPELFGRAVVESSLGSELVIPASAVVNTGRRQVVWEEIEPHRFTPRHVVLAHRVGDWYQVLEGLESGAMLASSGGFLLDSESQLKAMAGGSAMSGHADHGDSGTGPTVPPTATTGHEGHGGGDR
jgi:Cu(I)/Ag(I) efflux system membrane fusion protein